MSKLLEDEKVAALVEKEVAKGVKAETKRVLELVKNTATEVKEDGDLDKGVKKGLAERFKDLTTAIKEAA